VVEFALFVEFKLVDDYDKSTLDVDFYTVVLLSLTSWELSLFKLTVVFVAWFTG